MVDADWRFPHSLTSTVCTLTNYSAPAAEMYCRCVELKDGTHPAARVARHGGDWAETSTGTGRSLVKVLRGQVNFWNKRDTPQK